jgi:transcriptional regulator with XRE-family HTH domain
MKDSSEPSITESNNKANIESATSDLTAESADYYQQVALNMRRARRKLNLTQQQIADAMQIPRSTYKSLESGNTRIYCYYMAKWSKITGIDVRSLTHGSAYDLTSDIKNYKLLEQINYLTKEQVVAVTALIEAFDR